MVERIGTREAADLLHWSQQWIWKLAVREGKVRYQKTVRDAILVAREDVEAWLAEHPPEARTVVRVRNRDMAKPVFRVRLYGDKRLYLRVDIVGEVGEALLAKLEKLGFKLFRKAYRLRLSPSEESLAKVKELYQKLGRAVAVDERDEFTRGLLATAESEFGEWLKRACAAAYVEGGGSGDGRN